LSIRQINPWPTQSFDDFKEHAGMRIRMAFREIISAVGISMGIVAFCTVFQSASAETRGYAISMFHVATYGSQGNCPQGGNGTSAEIQRRTLLKMGFTKEEAAKIQVDYKNSKGQPVDPDLRGHVNGQAVDVEDFPTSVPDPEVETVQGKVAYGLDLGGSQLSAKFEDPDTHEKVDNQLWRAVGCYKNYDIRLPVRPFYEDIIWDTQMDAMPAWIFSVTGNDLGADGDVTVTFDRALNHLIRDVNGKAMRGVTFTIDPSPRSHSVFRGHLRNGELTIDPGPFSMTGDPPVQQIVRFSHTQLRLKFSSDGSAKGLIGGYQPWLDFYYWAAIAGETDSQMNLPGLYYSLRRLADAEPDPKTGLNTAISAAYWIEVVPAFLVSEDKRVSTNGQP
jgi:hypothetical protein